MASRSRGDCMRPSSSSGDDIGPAKNERSETSHTWWAWAMKARHSGPLPGDSASAAATASSRSARWSKVVPSANR